MRQTKAKKIRKITESQFADIVKDPKVLRKIYQRVKTAWNKSPTNERAALETMFVSANGLRAHFMKQLETGQNRFKQI